MYFLCYILDDECCMFISDTHLDNLLYVENMFAQGAKELDKFVVDLML